MKLNVLAEELEGRGEWGGACRGVKTQDIMLEDGILEGKQGLLLLQGLGRVAGWQGW